MRACLSGGVSLLGKRNEKERTIVIMMNSGSAVSCRVSPFSMFTLYSFAVSFLALMLWGWACRGWVERGP